SRGQQNISMLIPATSRAQGGEPLSMALIGANELKKKLLIEFEGQPYSVLEVVFATPSARGASTMVRTRMKNLLTGAVQERSFKTSEKFGEPDVEMAKVSFL